MEEQKQVAPGIKASELLFRHISSIDPAAKVAREFVRENHYSKACPPGHHYFGAFYGDRLVGVAVYRKPSLPKTRAAYGADIELSRLVLLDECGKNSESRFIGFQLRWLKKHSWPTRAISFADPHYGHDGTIYKASNFEYLGYEKGHGTRRIYIDGEELHSKTAYDRYGCSGSKLADLLPNSTVEIVVRPPKHVYVYPIKSMRHLAHASETIH